MLKSLSKSYWFVLSMLFIICYSCKEDTTPLDDRQESYTVAVRFAAFETIVNLLGKPPVSTLLSNVGTYEPTANGQIPYLYYWSFNGSSITPDIWLDGAASIRYNDELEPRNFDAAGWASNGYPAGKAMAITGGEQIIFQLPLVGGQKVASFGFDISSSGTGPNSFTLSYSQNVDNYRFLVEENQFANITGSYPKNSFLYYLDTIALDYRLPLFIKLVAKAGDRGNGSAYNPKTGVIRMDNIFLKGLKSDSSSNKVRQLSYHIFDAQRKSLIVTGQAPFAENTVPTLFVELPPGDYKGAFVSNDSEAELLMPNQATMEQFYIGNLFSNRRAKVYGLELDFTVRKDLEFDLLLRRYYSQVKFEFTDNRDLSAVKRIVVKQAHSPFYYAPFGKMTVNPIVDQTEITYAVDFDRESKELVFNQFMGNLAVASQIAYTLDVYNQADKLLRTFTVSGNIKNNVRLVFRGELLSGIDASNNFIVRYQEDWDGDDTIDF